MFILFSELTPTLLHHVLINYYNVNIIMTLYILVYLCVILHGNDLMRMLNHHVLERDR